jgi:diguanylate cyclase (GGDEF)-like protein
MNSEIKWPIEIEHYERKIYDLKQLIEIAKGLNSTLEYNTLIESILLTCMGQMQLFKVGIFLKKSLDSKYFDFHRNYKGFEVDHGNDYRIEIESPFIELIKNKTKCYTMDEVKSAVDDPNSIRVFESLDPMLVVPIFGRQEVHGMIILADKINGEEFQHVEKDYLMNIASLAAISINNAVLYEKATTDMMTHLKIHHYFQSALADEFIRTVKSESDLSILMIDIDFFKKFNDNFGHMAGDHALERVAAILKKNIRPMDTAARYGGEEFALILPRTDIHEALIVAERIRDSIKNEKIIFDNDVLSVTVSIGIACYDPELDKFKESLLKRSDDALYVSKENGRDMVSLL